LLCPALDSTPAAQRSWHTLGTKTPALLLTDWAGKTVTHPSVKPLTGVLYRPLDGGSTASGAGWLRRRARDFAKRWGADSLAAAA
jgi:hypothetical protein